MKISKSKQELARIISENGGWRDGEFAAQDKTSARIDFYKEKPWINGGQGRWNGEYIVNHKMYAPKVIRNWHQTILSRAEYFHLHPAPDADGWIEWNGGSRPVSEIERVDIKLRMGEVWFDRDSRWRWSRDGHETDIIAYRLHKPEQSNPEFCESVMRSIPEPEAKPTIEQLAADYRNAKDYAERKQREADAAKADAEAKLKELELAGEALGLLVSPITAKQESGLVITDWRQWKVGDYVSWSIISRRAEFKIISVHHDESREIGDFEITDEDGYVFRCYGDECKFIRRP